MNNIVIAKETMQIIKNKFYQIGEDRVNLPEMNYSDVTVYSPEQGMSLLSEENDKKGENCIITITTEDSYKAAARYKDAMVMNFANAHNPGGGFLMGATAQEESLCRCSTLYASISSQTASEMYKYNNIHLSKVESDYMLYSSVCVFRDNTGKLLEQPFITNVISVPAPNRIGAAVFASEKEVADAMCRRIRIMSMIAYKNGCKNMVLGAWGCGAFHNNPNKVASYFKTVLIDEGYGTLFDEICFAIYGKENGANIVAFRNCFQNQT